MITPAEQAICQRRVVKECGDLCGDPLPNVKIGCDASDKLNWYCLIHSLNEEVYAGGEYIVNIKLSPRYPFEAPDFYMLTPNGRFDVMKKLCFSNSSYHQKEGWSPMWTMRTIILGFLSFFLEKTSTGIGHIDTTDEVKKKFAEGSTAFNSANHPMIMRLLPE
jgi:ubiquitin-protein ligase